MIRQQEKIKSIIFASQTTAARNFIAPSTCTQPEDTSWEREAHGTSGHQPSTGMVGST